MNKKELLRKIKFTIFSISAGLVEIGLFTLLDNVTNLYYWPKYLIALVASVISNFTLNRNYTFKSASNVSIAMFKVFIFYLVFTPTSTILGNILVNKLYWNEYLVTLINMLCNFILEYLYDKYVVFKNSIDTLDKK